MFLILLCSFYMLSGKNMLGILFVSLATLRFTAFADDITDMKASVTDTMTKLIQRYESRIRELEAENGQMKQELANLRSTTTQASASVVTTTPVITSAMAKSDLYNAVVKRANDQLKNIQIENNLSTDSVIGLFEFIEPNAVFISLDDGNNPADVSAFKTKVLYTFDNNLNFTRIGLFDLNYASQKYRTLFGSNPYTKALRVRVENPGYKGQLLNKTGTTNTGTVVKPSSVVTESTTEATLAQIKAAYDKNKLLDALKLSDSYIAKNPNDVEALRIRYRSYYMIGKYESSLAEIKKLETVQGSAFEKTVACDAAVIGKIAKKTDVSNYYSAICKKK